MHHYGFLRGSITEEEDEFHLVLFNAETGGQLTISGKLSERFFPDVPTVEFFGNVIADALNEATSSEGEAMT